MFNEFKILTQHRFYHQQCQFVSTKKITCEIFKSILYLYSGITIEKHILQDWSKRSYSINIDYALINIIFYLSVTPSYFKNCWCLSNSEALSQSSVFVVDRDDDIRLAAMYGSSGIGSSGFTNMPWLVRYCLVYSSQPHNLYVTLYSDTSTPMLKSAQCHVWFGRRGFGTGHRFNTVPWT